MTWEVQFLLWIQDYLVNGFLTPCMRLITTLGNSGFIWIVFVVYFMFIKKDKKQAKVMVIALLLNLLVTNVIVKNLVSRTRPFDIYPYVDLLINKPTDFSFPSGHTSASFACAMVIAHYYPKWRIPVIGFASLMAISRLYFFVHFPTDIIGGILIGMCMAYFAISLEQEGYLEKKHV